MPGTLRAIYLKPQRRGTMLTAERATLKAGAGIVGNANQGGPRQVTILEEERWAAAMRALDASLPGHARRANLLVSGIALPHSTGRVLRVGDVCVRILGETKPCSRMDDALPGLREALKPDWGGGAYGEVLSGGDITLGDAVGWDDDPSGGGQDVLA